MIEVMFGESEAGSMKAAKVRSSKIKNLKSEKEDSAITGDTDQQPQLWIPGTSDEVLCLAFMLDIGDIQEPVDSDYRRELICSMYAGEAWGRDSKMETELKKAADVYVNELSRLESYIKQGEALRIWYSDAPYSLCGLYYLCKLLQTAENDIRAVKLPECRMQSGKEKDKTMISCQNWGGVAAEEFADFLQYERPLSKEERRRYAALWDELAERNGPLRAVINGRLVSVPTDFYDFLIWENLTEEPIREGRLIGNILLRQPISVGDWWYAKRIDEYIRQGRIRVTEDSEKLYARMICRGVQ